MVTSTANLLGFFCPSTLLKVTEPKIELITYAVGNGKNRFLLKVFGTHSYLKRDSKILSFIVGDYSKIYEGFI